MKTRKAFKPTYHNNEFNYLISELTDLKRSIIDIDCVLTKFNYNTFFIDHKKNGDLTSINTVRTLANYVDVRLTDSTKIQCFIVRSNVNTETCETIDGITMVYEIKNIKEVKDRKNKSEYIKSVYRITNDEYLKLFFQQETHNQIKDKLKVKL